MLLQLSSGQGPAECELAVGKFLRYIKEYFDITVIEHVNGKYADCYKSVLISGSEDLKELEGSIKWICTSPYRPKHKRKNWFIDISICRSMCDTVFDEKLVRYETFRSGGKGGQNVNKVETGVRVIYVPTGLSVVSTTARSQHMNKKMALNRLCEIIAQKNNNNAAERDHYKWLEHTRLERGNAVLTFEGLEFVLKAE